MTFCDPPFFLEGITMKKKKQNVAQEYTVRNEKAQIVTIAPTLTFGGPRGPD